ncbi:hypothetical protein F2Q69_00002232 [Brassica cretica]|uniref:Uncharacterized protein n=1 Tax=Brassica cretica TaxID=69181 RepID=A0A8S9NS91_BRACR|nr:hypothetical protein F2Q69_00002232 [Brassica cretica]
MSVCPVLIQTFCKTSSPLQDLIGATTLMVEKYWHLTKIIGLVVAIFSSMFQWMSILCIAWRKATKICHFLRAADRRKIGVDGVQSFVVKKTVAVAELKSFTGGVTAEEPRR